MALIDATDISELESSAEQGIPDGLVAKVAHFGKELYKTQNSIIRLEAEIADLKEVKRTIKEVTLPALMEEAGGMRSFASDGFSIKIEDRVTARIPTLKSGDFEGRERCHAWLESHDYGRIIKRELQVSVGKGQGEFAERLTALIVEAAADEERNVDVGESVGVNHNTFRSFVKQCLAEGVDLPEELFGRISIPTAEVKLTK